MEPKKQPATMPSQRIPNPMATSLLVEYTAFTLRQKRAALEGTAHGKHQSKATCNAVHDSTSATRDHDKCAAISTLLWGHSVENANDQLNFSYIV